MHDACLWMALAFLRAGDLLIVPSVVRRRPSLSPASLGALGIGLTRMAAALIVEASNLHPLPVTDVRSALSFYAFPVDSRLFLCVPAVPNRLPGSIHACRSFFLLTLISTFRPPGSFDSSAFRGGWLLVHISSIFLGYNSPVSSPSSPRSCTCFRSAS